jgi:putative addiction module component (TIGR02574 family)
MREETKTLCDAARKLSPIERLELVEGILASLDEPDAALDRLWASEAEDRMAAYRRGELKAKPRGRVFGAMKGKATVTDAFFEPLPDEELDAWSQ